MAVQALTITEIVLVKFEVSTRQCTVHVHFESGAPVAYSFPLSSDFDAILHNLLAAVKRGKCDSRSSFSDGPLAGYNPVHILNLEDLEERFPKGLAQFQGDIRSFSRTTDASSYMQTRASLQDSHRVLFKIR